MTIQSPFEEARPLGLQAYHPPNNGPEDEINKLLENLLNMKIDEFEVVDCVKLIHGITKGVISPVLDTGFLDLSSESINQIIMCLKAIKRIVCFCPAVLHYNVDGQEDETIYQYLIPRILPLAQIPSNEITSLVDICLQSTINITGSDTDLFKRNLLIVTPHLFDACFELLDFAQVGVLPESTNLPTLLQSLPRISCLETALRIIVNFFRIMSSSSAFVQVLEPATLSSLFHLTSKSLQSLKSLSWESSLKRAPPFFIEIFMAAFSTIPSDRSSWCDLIIKWLCFIRRCADEITIPSSLDMSATLLAIDIIERIVTNEAGVVQCSDPYGVINSKKSSDSKALRRSSNASRALSIVFGLLNSKDGFSYDTGLIQSLTFADPVLQQKVQELHIAVQRSTFTLSSCTPGFQWNGTLFSKIFDGLPFLSKRIEEPHELKIFIKEKFNSLSIYNKVLLIRRVGLSACFMVGTLDISTMRCKHCDSGIISAVKVRPTYQLYEIIFDTIIKAPEFYDSKLLRLETLKSFRRAVSGIDITFDPNNGLGSWILGSITSTHRDIRIAASMILPFFAFSPTLTNKSIDELSQIDLNSRPDFTETTIMAWAALAKNSEDDALNMILVKLVDMFALRNNYSTSLTIYSIQSIARHKKVTTWNLFAPFWKTISMSVIKQKFTNPIILSRFCRLLGIPVDEFLAQTHFYTVPYLVWNGDREHVESIALSLKFHVEQLILTDLASILAVSFLNEIKANGSVSQNAELAKTNISSICESFQRVDLMGVITTSRLEISFELLKRYNSRDSGRIKDMSDEAHKKKMMDDFSEIFSFVNSAVVRKSKKGSKSKSQMELFFEENILGLIPMFTEAIRDTSGKTSYTEKLECLHGLTNLMHCSGHALYKAIPQVCALLQAALDVSFLQAAAIKAWDVMLRTFNPPDLIEQTDLVFSVVIQKWALLTEEAQINSRELLKYLVVDQKDQFKHILLTRGVPHMSGMRPHLGDLYDVIESMILDNLKPVQRLLQLLRRTFDENMYVVRQTIQELRAFLAANLEWIHNAMNDPAQGKIFVERMFKMLLSTSSQFHGSTTDIPYMCSQCLGILGAADPSKFDIATENHSMIVTHNFSDAEESITFVCYFLENYLVKAFRSSSDPNAQAFLAYGIQEYLKFCGLHSNTLSEGTQNERWDSFFPSSQAIMRPMRTSRYTLTASPAHEPETYPIFDTGIDHFTWLQRFTIDLLHKANQNPNSERIFKVFRKFIVYLDASVYSFILPYAALNVVLSESSKYRRNILNELLLILGTDNDNKNTNMRPFYSSVFSILDYFNNWKRHRQQHLGKNISRSKSSSRSSSSSSNVILSDTLISIIDSVMNSISPNLMARRSYECKSYPRAIMCWEQFLEKNPNTSSAIRDGIYSKFMEMYANINDPDSLEGAARFFKKLSIPQKVLQMENTGRWDEALECYESLSKSHGWEWDSDTGYSMFRCMKQGGNYDSLLSLLDSMMLSNMQIPERLLGVGIETAWLAGDFKKMGTLLRQISYDSNIDKSFEVSIARALISLQHSDTEEFANRIEMARRVISETLGSSPISSLYQCHEVLVRLHGLTDLELIGDLTNDPERYDHSTMSAWFNRRLSHVGANYETKVYLLALRRSAILSTSLSYAQQEAQVTWIHSSRFARKQNQYKLALRASLNGLSDNRFVNYEAYIEYAKLFWTQDDYHEAIKCLDGMVAGGLLAYLTAKDSEEVNQPQKNSQNRAVVDKYLAKAALLQTKWLDISGEGKSSEIMNRYALIARVYPQWEKSHYYSAKYFNRIYDSQAAQKIENRSSDFFTGYYISLMVRNYAMSLPYGVKYVYESLPKMFSLWLDFADIMFKMSPQSYPEGYDSKSFTSSKNSLAQINEFLMKHMDRVPYFVFYMALPQIMSRIPVHEPGASEVLNDIVIKIIKSYPRQALWYIFGKKSTKGSTRSSDIPRSIINALRGSSAVPGTSQDLRSLFESGINFVDTLSKLAYFKTDKSVSSAKLKEFNFNMNVVPCGLVVPVQQCMRVTLPSVPDPLKMKNHRAFSSVITIAKIDETVEMMNSLQRPKKIVLVGSNGVRYKILCKSHDDVRKDARLMDLTFTIDSMLQRDDKAFKRRLYIKTYFVMPLSEDSGLIEWVDGTRPLRDILTVEHSSRGNAVNWKMIKDCLSVSHTNSKEILQGFRRIIQQYPPVLKNWFLEVFPEPGAWLEGRGKYAKSLAVMSMVGYILGVGDRHGENILFDVNTGGIMHVDFDCLFDKGKDLEMPELVPFRLTHNMVDAFGVFGYEGIFRKSSEVTLELIRMHQDVVMTMLDVFLHDPILDWAKQQRSRSKKKQAARDMKGPGGAKSPEEALWSIQNRILGRLHDEAMPLKVPGQVSYLIAEATDEHNLAHMYIGWMAYF